MPKNIKKYEVISSEKALMKFSKEGFPIAVPQENFLMRL